MWLNINSLGINIKTHTVGKTIINHSFENSLYNTYKNADDWGMVSDIESPHIKSSILCYPQTPLSTLHPVAFKRSVIGFNRAAQHEIQQCQGLAPHGRLLAAAQQSVPRHPGGPRGGGEQAEGLPRSRRKPEKCEVFGIQKKDGMWATSDEFCGKWLFVLSFFGCGVMHGDQSSGRISPPIIEIQKCCFMRGFPWWISTISKTYYACDELISSSMKVHLAMLDGLTCGNGMIHW